MNAQQQRSPGDRKKIQVSFIIRDEEERLNRSGVNSLQFDPVANKLYTAGRDSIIRIWQQGAENEDANASPKSYSDGGYITSMEHHTDWVNDIVLCNKGKTLISASSDGNVKVWNTRRGYCMSTLRTHKDYVWALAYAKHKEQVASAGLDKQIFIWDVNTLNALTLSRNTVATFNVNGCKQSIYSLAMSANGNVLVAGSTERALRVWDPRTCEKRMKLKGHTDNVKALIVNQDGTQVLSGSSDGTIRLWSLGQQRCITTMKVHQEGVWALATPEGDCVTSFNQVYSAGRDRRVVSAELCNPEATRYVVCEESAPVLKLAVNPCENTNEIFVATTQSHVNVWPLKRASDDMEEDIDDTYDDALSEQEFLINAQAEFKEPVHTFPGGAGICQCRILPDKRYILTKDTNGDLALWDILNARKSLDLPGKDFDIEYEKRSRLVFVPSWFTVDLKLGMLTIHLEEPDCFSAWVTENNLNDKNDPTTRLNYGGLMLQALLEHWSSKHVFLDRESDQEEKKEDGNSGENPEKDPSRETKGNRHFSVPIHTPVIFSEVDGRSVFRFICGDAAKEPDSMSLRQVAPQWLIDTVVKRQVPVQIGNLPFFLLPYPGSSVKSLSKDKLTAGSMLLMYKVMEHVYDKILCNDDSNAGDESESQSNQQKDSIDGNAKDDFSVAVSKVELLCKDQILDPTLDLRTVRHLIWKNFTDVVIHYRLKS